MPEIGDSIDRYVLEAVLGSGGMGRVYQALDPRLNRRVALKLLLTHGANTSSAAGEVARARLLREARAAAAFNHPNVVAIYDVGEVDENPFIAMELVSGSVLRSYVGDLGVSVPAKVAWLVDVARGLGAAHRAGFVHRDIKPDNVMLTADGVIKILDFGIARRSDTLVDADAATEAGLPNVTPGNIVVGTPQYMAPEQIRGLPLDGRTDQFAWGVMAYELLGGSIPWSGTTGLAVVASILSEELTFVPDPVRVGHPAAEAVILRALSKSADDRFPTMDALVEALVGARVVTAPTPTAKTAAEDVAFAPTTAQPVVSSGALEKPPSARGAEQTPVDARPVPAATTAPSSERAPRLRARSAALRALAVGAVIASAVQVWHVAHTPRVSYCLVVDETDHGPRCAARVDASVAARRHTSISRVTEVLGRVTRVESVNFVGLSLPREEIVFDDTDDDRSDVAYDDVGHVHEVVTHNANGVETAHERWGEGGARIDLVDVDGRSPRHASTEERYTTERREFDEQGRVTRVGYFGPTGRPRADNDGGYGLRIEYGVAPGARVKTTRLGSDGLPVARAKGAAITQATDDEVPGGREITWLGVDGKPVAESGVFRHVQRWDGAEITSTAVFGPDGAPAVGFSASVHEIRTSFDPKTRTQTYAFFDEHGKPQVYRDEWFSAVRLTKDARGRDVLIESLDAQGNRTLVKRGITAVRCTYDDANNEVRREHEGPNGAPMRGGEEGYARADFTRDRHGNAIEERFFDEHGNPSASRDGVAIRRTTYDERDLPTSIATFDVHGAPVTTAAGWATKQVQYDRLRNLVMIAFSGVDGRPTVNDQGYSMERWTYDDNDDLVSLAYFDASGAPTMLEGDFAQKRMKRDERGLTIEETYLDVHGERVLQRDGYAVVQEERDRSGDVVLESYLGTRSELVLREGGYAKKKTSYDIHRRPIAIELLDRNGAPVVGADGWAIERSVYDERGLVVRVDHEGTDSRPALDKLGRASWARVYDARLNVIEESNLGPDGKPVVARDGWATRKTAYDDRDEQTEESLFGAVGEPVVGMGGWAVHRVRHDDFGDIVEEAFFDAAHHATALKDATFASERSRYDDRHALVEIAYLDVSGAPASGPDGAALVRYTRDAYGRVVETAYLDGAGVPMASSDGKITVHTHYDHVGRPVEELFVDTADALTASSDGCAGHRMRYDPQGHEVERTCVGPSGQSAVGREGWAIRRTLHDARGNAVEESTYGTDGSPRADADGVARTKRRYDERDRLLEVVVFGVDGKPGHDRRRVHMTRYAYDEGRRQMGVLTFDEHGKPIPTQVGARP